MEFAASTHVGKRLKNEDNYFIPRDGDGAVFIAVADGMGGHAAGARASTLAVEGLYRTLNDNEQDDEPIARLRSALHTVNRLIYRHARTEEGCRGMGTTLVAALLFEKEYIAANIGDSRLYHLDDMGFSQVTRDHSLVAVLVRDGAITYEEAHVHPQRNIITRALGTMPNEEADYFHRRWNKGDTLLLCSDGLHGVVGDDEIECVLRENLTLQETCDTLIARALSLGAADNITVTIARNGVAV